MEVLLLWLDEFDDVVFVVASLSQRLRRLCLQIGLLAALTLVGCELAPEAQSWSSALASVAGASVALWFLVALAFFARQLDLRAAFSRA